MLSIEGKRLQTLKEGKKEPTPKTLTHAVNDAHVESMVEAEAAGGAQAQMLKASALEEESSASEEAFSADVKIGEEEQFEAKAEDNQEDEQGILGALNESTARFPPECWETSWRWQWLGTAPSCGSNKRHCQDRGGTFVRYDAYGDGSYCWWGWKVLCKIPDRYIKDDCHPECSRNFNRQWVGTAPWCAASDCDCIRQNKVPVKVSSNNPGCPCKNRGRCPHFGANCHFGNKVFCIGPAVWGNKTMEDDLKRARLNDCTKRQEINEQTKRVMIQSATQIAVAGIKAKGGKKR